MITFTEDELRMCLTEAAMMRASYHVRGDPLDQQPAEYLEAAKWDALARKIAEHSGIELEQDCHDCHPQKPGRANYHDGACSSCEGTGTLPPRHVEAEHG